MPKTAQDVRATCVGASVVTSMLGTAPAGQVLLDHTVIAVRMATLASTVAKAADRANVVPQPRISTAMPSAGSVNANLV